MIYEYYCTKCDHEFEESHSSDNRLIPCGEPCPNCNEKSVKKAISNSGISYDGMKSPHTRSTPEFKERLREIKKGAGKFHNIYQ